MNRWRWITAVQAEGSLVTKQTRNKTSIFIFNMYHDLIWRTLRTLCDAVMHKDIMSFNCAHSARVSHVNFLIKKAGVLR